MINIIRTTVSREYSHGALQVSIDGFVRYIKYNTGDQVWFDINGKVIRINTHDGLDKQYEQPIERGSLWKS